ncbi:glycosyltransferase [Campylobacter jejuni]|uniref:glycosyltransferase family 2 protein n=1 Tax=Campylobacter jejuni TaxID=197 RepID=UPI000F7FDD07|nr:glycosyltransferase [Campylobacter jejuni]EDP1927694.1 glycosyltransferase [Campylobacter jejuni]RTH81444.1 glycosyl transferase family 2 [Campylobacter jejuni]RTH92368.1 glycosyl transferase family 2 [Campylobacter jejuni]HEC1908185.1 glycosyltransferase [Campylobacter jejuni]
MNLKQISVIIIVKNAEQTLLECLNSLKDFDEIILLNNESSDNTLNIANEFKKDFANLHIYHSTFIGFGALKNLALSYAKNDWILSIDADEVLENECINELKNLEFKKEDIIALSRKNLYKGEWIKACGWWPDYVLRIFNKNFTRFNDNLVHESLILQSNAKKIYLKNGLKHYSYKDISHLIDKMQYYSSLWAKQNIHKKSRVLKANLRAFWTFFRNYFLKSGFLYGYKGFIISVCNALGVFFKYMKLYELQRQKPETCALIITTYNQKERLKLVLDSVKNLAFLPNEVLIADDGSKEDTARLIKEYQKDFPCSLKHIWQEDEGFRLSKSRNKTIKNADSEYIIVIDGDMILEKDFIKEHLEFAQRKLFLQGSRVILNKKESEEILNKDDYRIAFNKKDFKSSKNSFLAKILYNLSKKDEKIFKKTTLIKGIRGCNMSFFKTDFDELDGFNENFIGWGREDSEFVARFLFNKGIFRRLKFKAIAYHIYHEENSKKMLESNRHIYLDTIKNKKISWR